MTENSYEGRCNFVNRALIWSKYGPDGIMTIMTTAQWKSNKTGLILRFCLQQATASKLGLFQIVRFTTQPNKNNF